MNKKFSIFCIYMKSGLLDYISAFESKFSKDMTDEDQKEIIDLLVERFEELFYHLIEIKVIIAETSTSVFFQLNCYPGGDMIQKSADKKIKIFCNKSMILDNMSYEKLSNYSITNSIFNANRNTQKIYVINLLSTKWIDQDNPTKVLANDF